MNRKVSSKEYPFYWNQIWIVTIFCWAFTFLFITQSIWILGLQCGIVAVITNETVHRIKAKKVPAPKKEESKLYLVK